MTLTVTQGDIEREVRSLVLDRLNAKLPTNADWLVEAIVMAHAADLIALGPGPKADWFLVNSYGNVRQAVRHVLQGFRLQPEPTQEELRFPGYRHMQKGYLVSRARDQVMVATEDCSDEELEGKAAELDRMAEGCRQHAQEIRRYVAVRKMRPTG